MVKSLLFSNILDVTVGLMQAIQQNIDISTTVSDSGMKNDENNGGYYETGTAENPEEYMNTDRIPPHVEQFGRHLLTH